MLAKGEVDEIIVRPDVEIVTIILHEGAVIKGKRVNNLKHLEFILKKFSINCCFRWTTGHFI